MGLAQLPDEVLEIALKYLLPPFRSQSLAETYVFTVPIDLLAARLVSRRLDRIATPLAWRRVQLQIASPAVANYRNLGLACAGGSGATVSETKASLRSLVRTRFFQERPQLAAHVRVLLISLDWHAQSPVPARDALREATRAMSNLRTVLVWDTDVLAPEDIRALLRRPLLRAICIMDVDGSAFSLPESGGGEAGACEWGGGLKMLHVANSVCPARLIAGAASSLECVSIELARTGVVTNAMPTLREMPWRTLKEVALVDCVNEQDWFCFLEGFRIHRQLGLPTTLVELMVGDIAGLESYRVTQLLNSFAGHSLTRLTLYHVVTLDPPTVARIIQAFPTLRHLSLLTEGALAPWIGSVDSYAQVIADHLPSLQSLAWNNFFLEPALDTAFYLLSAATLGKMYARHVRALVRRVRTLRCVKFVSVADCIVDTVIVGGRGGDADSGMIPVEVRRTTEAALHTSSWCTTSDAFDDI